MVDYEGTLAEIGKHDPYSLEWCGAVYKNYPAIRSSLELAIAANPEDGLSPLRIEFAAGHMAGRKFEREYQSKLRTQLLAKITDMKMEVPTDCLDRRLGIINVNAALDVVIAMIAAQTGERE